MFSRDLIDAMQEALSRKKAIVLFLNKRGHTSFVFCRKCGHAMTCDACDVALTYHRRGNHLRCHYCGRTQKKPLRCPICNSRAIKEFGAGTEKLEEETRALFPEARIARIDSDTTQKKGEYEKFYRIMREGKIDILIGTQMIAKGLDFPQVTVVGVMAADLTLNMPDFRASERTFQLLTQVAGRAGRGDEKGHVLIQTYKPNHYAIVTAAKNDYKAFYNREIEARRNFQYPPFTELLVIRMSHPDRNLLHQKLNEFKERLDRVIKKYELSNCLVEGPMPNLIERVNYRYRYQLIYKFKGKETMIKCLDELLKSWGYRDSLREFWLNIHLDPASIM